MKMMRHFYLPKYFNLGEYYEFFFRTILTPTHSKKKTVGKLLTIIRRQKNRINNTIKLICKKTLIAFWWTGAEGKNWGDAINPILIKNMSGKEAILPHEVINLKNVPIYSVIGSILGFCSDKNLIIWGSGFISSSSRLIEKPNKICAVRGPLTRNIIIKQGIDCPEIYGDPALLYPLFYKPVIRKKYKLGVIPHFRDQNHPALSIFKDHPEVVIIDILAGINVVVDSICSCECILSSSLHGIIASDSYGIPSIWMILSDNIGGDRFKFYDYFMSVGRKNEKPLFMTENTSHQSIYDQFHPYNINIDLIKLVKSCPFLNETEKNKLVKKIHFCFKLHFI